MTPDLLVTNLLGNALLGAVGVTLLHFVWQGALLALGLALSLRMLRPERAELRYALACGVLLLMVVAPLATFGGLYGFYGGSSPVTNPAVSLESPASEVESVDEAQNDEALPPSTAPAQQVAPAAPTGEATRPPGSFYSFYASFDFPRVAPYLTLLWGLGVLLLTLRLLGGVWVSARLGRRGRLAPARYQQRLLELSHHLGLRESVRLLESSAVAVPVVAGWLKPVILLPSSALSGLTPLQLEMILAHELAHVRRRDPLVNALQHLVETALFYHPAVWWVSRVMRQERESCCDDIATRLCGDPLAYAETLARLERLRSPSPLVLAGSGGRLKNRIERLVGVQGKPSGSPLVTFGLAVGLVGLLGVAGVLAQSGGAVPDASPVVPLTLPERSLWVDILGDVSFTDDYKNIADVGEDGLFVLEERRNGEPYRLLIVMGERGGPIHVSGEDIRMLTVGGGPFYLYAEEGTFDLERGNGNAKSLAVQDAKLIVSGELNRLKMDHPDIARWLEGGLEQTVAQVVRERQADTPEGEDPIASLAAATGYLNQEEGRPLPGEGYYSLVKEISSGLSGTLMPPSYVWRPEDSPDPAGDITFTLWGAQHYLAHNLTTDEDVLEVIRVVTEDNAENLNEPIDLLLLKVAAEFRTDSAKADALVAIARVLPEDTELREEYRRVAGTIEDEALQRRALDALTTSQGSTGLEEVYRALAETMNRARLLFPHAEDAPFGSQNPVQPLYDEARAYCNGEKTLDGVFDTYFTMLTARPDADTDFFIKPDVENLVQTCVERFITDSDFRERFRNPSERDFLLDR